MTVTNFDSKSFKDEGFQMHQNAWYTGQMFNLIDFTDVKCALDGFGVEACASIRDPLNARTAGSRQSVPIGTVSVNGLKMQNSMRPKLYFETHAHTVSHVLGTVKM